MAITTVDGIINGVRPINPFCKSSGSIAAVGTMKSLIQAAGSPGPADLSGLNINGSALTSLAGSLPYVNPTSPALSYLAKLEIAASQAGSLFLFDRLWHNVIASDSTSAQYMSTPAFPARSVLSDNTGYGCFFVAELGADTTGGTDAVLTVSYTNSSNTASRTGTLTIPTGSKKGDMFFLSLQAGDTGVKALASVQLDQAIGGTINLVVCRQLACIGVMVAGGANYVDALTGGFPQIFDNSVLFLAWLPASTTTTLLTGGIGFTHG